MRTQFLRLAAFLAFSVGAVPAWSQDVPSAGESWTARCISAGRAEQADCSMEQRLFIEESGQLFSSLVVRVDGESRTANLAVTIPLGFHLPSGMRLQIDGTDLAALPIRNCDGNGCYAAMALSEGDLTRLSTAQGLAVGLQTLADERLGFDFPIAAFGATFERIR